MSLATVAIACFRWDLGYVRPCVASVRYFHPRARILLIKDRRYGDFCTREFERNFGVEIYPAKREAYGWGFSRMELLLDKSLGRFLFLDSDICLTGPLLDTLGAMKEDFIVSPYAVSGPHWDEWFYDRAKMRAMAPDFKIPAHVFNDGQMVARGGLLTEADLAPYVDWGSPPQVKAGDVFKLGVQGLVNFLLPYGAQQGRWSLRFAPYMVAGNLPEAAQLDLAEIRKGAASRSRVLIHWCGVHPAEVEDGPRGDIWGFFNGEYYKAVPGGWFWRRWHRAGRRVRAVLDWLRTRLRHNR